jgi:hypothetical protein
MKCAVCMQSCLDCARGEAGNVLLSHKAAPAVSLGLEGLTTVFGMGTGVSPPL